MSADIKKWHDRFNDLADDLRAKQGVAFPTQESAYEAASKCQSAEIADLRAALALAQAPSAPLAPDAQALLAARAEGRAEAVLMIMAEDPEDCLNDCMVGSGPCPASGEYDTHWDEEKLRAKFKAGDSTINMETKAELAYYEYMEARMVLEYEAMHRRDLAAPNFEAWFNAAAADYKAYDRDYSRKVWASAILSCRDALSVKAGSYPEIPEGWQLVPKEPDEMMQIRGDEATSGYVEWEAEGPTDGSDCAEMVDGIYKAMLRAAPTPLTTGETCSVALAQQIASAQAETDAWPEGKLARVKAQGGDQP